MLMVLGSIAIGPAAAVTDDAVVYQQAGNQTNATAPPGAPSNVEIVVDDDVAVTDWHYSDGTFKIDVYSSEYKTMTFAANPESRGSSGTFQWKVVALDKGKTTTVEVAATKAVTMSTEESRQAGRGYYIKKEGILISGPYSGDDVFNAGLGGAIGVTLAVLYEAMASKLAVSNPPERVA